MFSYYTKNSVELHTGRGGGKSRIRALAKRFLHNSYFISFSSFLSFVDCKNPDNNFLDYCIVFPRISKAIYCYVVIHISRCFQWVLTCSKLTIETLEQGEKYVQS